MLHACSVSRIPPISHMRVPAVYVVIRQRGTAFPITRDAYIIQDGVTPYKQCEIVYLQFSVRNLLTEFEQGEFRS